MKLPAFLSIRAVAAFANTAPVLLTAKQVCARLTISEPSLRRYERTVPNFPRPIPIGPRRKAYRLADVEAYESAGFQPSNG